MRFNRVLSAITALACSMTGYADYCLLAKAEDANAVVDTVMNSFGIWGENALQDTSNHYYVGFIDFDFDGTLELMVSTNQGDGRYTYLDVYRITGNQLKPFQFEYESGGIPDDDFVLYSDSNGNKAYYGTDYERWGMMYHTNTFCRLSYKATDTLAVSALYTEEYEYNQATEQEEYRYYSGSVESGNQISFDEYERVKSDASSGLKDLHLQYKMIYFNDVNSPNGRDKLLESYKAFSYDGYHVPAESPTPVEQTTQEGRHPCGPDAYWSFDEATETMTISGRGIVDAIEEQDWGDEGWSDWKHVVIEEGITELHNGPNFGFSVESISLPSTLTYIDDGFFGCMCVGGCDDDDPRGVADFVLREVYIPPSVTYIGDNAFNTHFGGDGYGHSYDNFAIKGYTGTTAESYAKKCGIRFIAMDDEVVTTEFFQEETAADIEVDANDLGSISEDLLTAEASEFKDQDSTIQEGKDTDTDNKQTAPSRQNTWWLWAIAAAALLVVVAIVAVIIIGLKKNWFVRYNSRQQKKISVKLIVLLVVMSGMIAVIVVSVVTLLKQTNSKNDTTAIDQTDML